MKEDGEIGNTSVTDEKVYPANDVDGNES